MMNSLTIMMFSVFVWYIYLIYHIIELAIDVEILKGNQNEKNVTVLLLKKKNHRVNPQSHSVRIRHSPLNVTALLLCDCTATEKEEPTRSHNQLGLQYATECDCTITE